MDASYKDHVFDVAVFGFCVGLVAGLITYFSFKFIAKKQLEKSPSIQGYYNKFTVTLHSIYTGVALALGIVMYQGNAVDNKYEAMFYAMGMCECILAALLLIERSRSPFFKGWKKYLGNITWDARILCGLIFFIAPLGMFGASSELERFLYIFLLFIGFQVTHTTEEFSRSKDRELYLGRLSHELRTPVAAARSLTESLYKGEVKDQAERQRFLGLILGEIDRLGRGLSRSLDLVRNNKTPSIEKTMTDIRKWSESVKDRWTTLLPNIKVSLPQSLIVNIDAGQLNEAVDALLDNAMRHGKEPVQFEVSQRNAQLQISVTDNGLGIREEKKDGLLKKMRGQDFDILTERDRGLGVWAAGNVARAHGGNLTVEGGSRFVLFIPLK